VVVTIPSGSDLCMTRKSEIHNAWSAWQGFVELNDLSGIGLGFIAQRVGLHQVAKLLRIVVNPMVGNRPQFFVQWWLECADSGGLFHALQRLSLQSILEL
jgi:hypothetical protein